MASIEETSTAKVVDGVNPDAVQVSPRIWRLAPIRERNPASPDFSNAGLDVHLLGDPAADGDNVTMFAVSESVRNGAKRVYSADGSPTLWSEPSPQSYDTAGGVSGSSGSPQVAIGSSGDITTTGVQATHSLSNVGADYPVIVRPVVSVAGARFESAESTLQALIATTLTAAADVNVTRDLFYGYGGSTSIVWPAVTVPIGAAYTFECDLQFANRVDIAEAFTYSITGMQVVFQVIEFTSSGA